jgi:phosphotransferase system enzyme I (PtsP)
MGGRTLEALALLGLGVRRLSITPASVGPVKAMIRAVDTRALAPFMADLLASQTPNVREPLLKWALENGVDLD